MRIREIELENYMVHESYRVELPERGIVLFVGKNGSGKSSFPEGVASLHNVCLRAPKSRKNRGFQLKKKSSVRVQTYDGLDATRTSSASGTLGLKYSIGGVAKDFPTATKTLESLVQDIGPFDVWMRCCYFSSKTAARFTEALDADRRLILEELVALGDFSAAHGKATDKERAHAKVVGEKQAALAVAENQLAIVARDVANAQQGLASLVSPVCPGTDADLQILRDTCTAWQQAEQKALALVQSFDVRLNEYQQRGGQRATVRATRSAELQQANSRLALLGQGSCPTCSQPIPGAMIQSLHGGAQAAQQGLQTYEAQAAREQQDDESLRFLAAEGRTFAQRDVDAKRQGYNDAVAQGIRLSSAITEYQRALVLHEQNKASWEAMVATAQQRITDAQTLADKLRAEVAAETRKVEVASTGAWMLSPKGFRAFLLGNVLGTVEQVTNRWIAMTDPDLRVEMRAYDENTKALHPSISLKIQGRESGDEYVDLSTGERLRVDLAFLFSIAEVTELIHGGTSTLGTLWLDEIFDGVDDVGVDAVLDLIRSVAQRRCVVVISHNEKIKFQLRPDIIYKFEKGNVANVAQTSQVAP